MSGRIGWALALLAMVLGGWFFGWRGVLVALSGTVFWLLLQFGRLMRLMSAVNSSPIGRVDSAVMLNARLRAGMKLIEVLPLTHSLGLKLHEAPETYAWTDAGGCRVELVIEAGRLRRWQLHRPAETGAQPSEPLREADGAAP